MQDENETQDWYDADGNCSENGCYDAGGHYYAERADIDYFLDCLREENNGN